MGHMTPSRTRRWVVRALLIVATILTVVSIFAVWANRQVLDADNWSDTSTALLENDEIRTQVSAFLVDQTYANVDVSAELARALPPRLKPLAPEAAGGLRTLAERGVNRALERPRFQQAWKQANRLTAQQFINIAEGKSGAITASGNAVVLDLRVLLVGIAERLGLPRSLVDKIPPNAGRIKIMSSEQISTVQDGAAALKGLAFVLPLIAIALFALAVYLAGGRRRRLLLFAGIDLVVAGIVVLIAANLIGQYVVNNLVNTDAVRPAADAAWSIATRMLRDVAQATIIIGIPAILAAWLAGPMRPATAVRRSAAPWLRFRPGAVYSAAAVLVLLVIAWGPIPATRMVLPVLIMIALLVVGIEALRRQVAAEFPDAIVGATRASLEAKVARAWGGVVAARERRQRAPAPAQDSTDAVPAAPPEPDRLERLERLAALHDTGALTDDEYAAEKASVLAGGVAP
jgi:hypothetical protein